MRHDPWRYHLVATCDPDWYEIRADDDRLLGRLHIVIGVVEIASRRHGECVKTNLSLTALQRDCERLVTQLAPPTVYD